MTTTNNNNNDDAASPTNPASQPPYASAPAPYNLVSPQQRAIWETKGKRSIGFGAAWLIGGLLVTLVTYAQAEGGGVYFVAWGPVLYGIYRVVSGFQLLNKSRS